MITDRLPAPALDLLLAFCLLSRLPTPNLPERVFARSARAVWAYPLVGFLLSAIACGVGLLALQVGLPAAIASGVTLALLCLMSGAMHEDGLADCADGFWGGHSPERRLEIMKDSQIGTFGTLALVFVTGLRWSACAVLLPLSAGPIIAAAALSRGTMPILMASLSHARDSGLSRSVGVPPRTSVVAGIVLAGVIGTVLTGIWALVAITLASATAAAMHWLAARKIGGQTGDVLGATQQASELVTLILFAAVFT